MPKQKKSRSGSASRASHRSMHSDSPFNAPCWVKSRKRAIQKPILSIQGWSVRVILGGESISASRSILCLSPWPRGSNHPIPCTTHRFDGGRRRTHRPAMDRMKHDRNYDIRSPPTLATFFSRFSPGKVWTFPGFDSMIRDLGVVPFFGASRPKHLVLRGLRRTENATHLPICINFLNHLFGFCGFVRSMAAVRTGPIQCVGAFFVPAGLRGFADVVASAH